MSWQTQAACAGEPPEWFDSTDPDWHGTAEALRLCAVCPVRQDCTDSQPRGRYGYEGIAGGMVWTGGKPNKTATRATRRNFGLAAA